MGLGCTSRQGAGAGAWEGRRESEVARYSWTPRTNLQVTCLVLMVAGLEGPCRATVSRSRRRRRRLGPAHPARPRHAGVHRPFRVASL